MSAAVASFSALVSVPDPNPPQHGSHLVSRVGILDAIRAWVGLGLGPRLSLHKSLIMMLKFCMLGKQSRWPLVQNMSRHGSTVVCALSSHPTEQRSGTDKLGVDSEGAQQLLQVWLE